MADVKDRLASALLLAAIAAASPTGCSQRMPADSGELVIAFPGAPVSIDPRLSTDAYGTQILQMTHASLIRMDAAGNPLPDLAEGFEARSPTEVVFRLRDGVRFHDGRELTSADVRDTFAWILNPRNRSPHRSTYETIREIETPDSRTVVFRLSEPFAPFLAGMVRGIVPAGTRAAGYSPPIGAGPYRVDDYEQDTAIRLSRFEGYHGGAARIEQVVVKFLPDSNVRFLELKKGSVNLVLNGVEPDLIPAVLENGNLVMEEAPGSNVSYLGFNLRDPFLSDARVRRAIALAIDREAIARTLWKGHADLADSLLAPGFWAHDDKIPPLRYDPAAARRLLEAAGYRDPDGDGPKPRFRLTYKTSQNELRRRIAAVIQEELRQAGIAVEIQSLEWGTFFSDIRKGNFQLYSLTWVGIADPDIYHYAFHSGQTPPEGANRGGYRNPEVDRLVTEGRRETSREKRKKIYGKVQQILSRDLPVFPLWINRNILVRDRRLTGFVITPDEDYASVKEMTFRKGKEAGK
ncbi:MAG: glutathione-binding protein gsiB [Deltaproteobacteria bacterium CSP1-8]|nr:MAG: glutathione-binding protein gsiB [Deltaproteobacteria bacterium CSP1-8]